MPTTTTAAAAAAAACRPVRPCRRRLLLSSYDRTPTALIFVALLVLAAAPEFSGAQEGGESSAEYLLKFKSSLANADPSLNNWDSTASTPCSGNQGNWIGVLCFNGYVWGLQLENMNLKGQIDVNSLTPLRFLRTLSFMNNGFEGTMPDWRKLGALKTLYLSSNQFSGQISEDAFKGMTSLKKVHLANNKFTGPIPSSLESPKLIELRLENNQFTGGIPAISSDNLRLLNVSNNQLVGPIPAALSKMDPTSFSGNKGLCGKPLEAACDPPIPPPDLEPTLLSPPTTSPAADATNEKSPSSPSRIAIIIISVLIALFLIVLLFLVYRRSRDDQTPQLGRELPPQEPHEDKKTLPAAAAASVVAAAGEQQQQQQQQSGKLSFVRDDRQKFDLQDLMRASAEVLGSGNFGASYKAVLVDGEALVVKRFKLMNNVAREDFHEHMRRLGRLSHPNLLPLVAYLYRKEEKLLVFDYINNGSLASHLHGKHSPDQPGLSWANRVKIVRGVAKGLAYLQSELPTLTVAHGHLKSSNILLDNEFNPLLMDYSLVPVVNPSQVHQILVAYKSPEYARNGVTCRKTDVWCLGVLILETLTGRYVANYLGQGCGKYGADLAGWIKTIVEENGESFDKEMEISSCRVETEKLLQIGISCCEEDPDKRWDLEEALRQIEQVQDSSSN
ncbi:hypothetical protein ACP275_04G089300 [Erythranthe tilingii]